MTDGHGDPAARRSLLDLPDIDLLCPLFMILPDKPAPELWINEIGVAPTHQRQEIGKRLLRYLLEDAK